jgi:hypothetical protein
MSNTIVLRNGLRALFLFAFQVLVLKQMNLGGIGFNYITLFLYPVFFMFLPITTPAWLATIIGFVYGYCLDIFYDTIGMHAAASVFSAYSRSVLLAILEPQGGYKDGGSPTRRQMGFIWFLRYAAIFMFLHIFFFFCVESYTLVYIVRIIKFTVPSYIVSLFFVMIYSFLFDPSE